MARGFQPSRKEDTSSITVRVPLSTKERLEALANDAGTSVAEVAAEAIDYALRSAPKPQRRSKAASASASRETPKDPAQGSLSVS